MTTPTRIDPGELPAAIRNFLTAHTAHDPDAAIEAFDRDAVVVDQGREFRGTGEVRQFLESAGVEFTYTIELVDAQRLDDAHWVATNHLEGDFPGGVADLDYRFTVEGGRITALAIG